MAEKQVHLLNSLVKKYFYKDYSHAAIIRMLQKEHNITIAPRTLSRVTAKLGLKRKNIDESPLEHVLVALIMELEGSGCNLGYKAMWQRLRKVYHLKVRQQTVWLMLREIDPEGVEDRCRYRLKRREYIVRGPNDLWHADNHDKLKRFGFALYGFIDGFSRKIMSINLASTNNKPEVIAFFYIQTVMKSQCIPAVLRTDKGTEATIMGDMQIALRSFQDDEFAGENSYVRGKSTRNQRIECYWRQFRQHLGQFYMDFFKEMEREGVLDIGNQIHIECLRYCFGDLLRDEIHTTIKEWNEHTIRRQDNRNVVTGKPNELYHLPERVGAVDCKIPLDEDHAEILFLEYAEEPQLCHPAFVDFVESSMQHKESPGTAEEAFQLYQDILEMMNAYNNA